MVTLRQVKMVRTGKSHRISSLRHIFSEWQPKMKHRLQGNKKTLASDSRTLRYSTHKKMRLRENP